MFPVVGTVLSQLKLLVLEPGQRVPHTHITKEVIKVKEHVQYAGMISVNPGPSQYLLYFYSLYSIEAVLTRMN
jgi:hypothetical protein